VKYDDITRGLVNAETIYNEKQNYPELIVEDILKEIDFLITFYIEKGLADKRQYTLSDEETLLNELKIDLRNKIYAILLKRGVNKWLLVRKLLIRLKKLYQEEINNTLKEIQTLKKEMERLIHPPKRMKDEHRILKERLKLLSRIRGELFTLCNTPRWVVWFYKEPGVISNDGMSEGRWNRWKRLFYTLWQEKFKK